MLNKIKKNKIWLIVILVVLILIPIFILILPVNKNQKEYKIPSSANIPTVIMTPTIPPLQRQQNLEKVVPGQSSEQEVAEILGRQFRKGSSQGYTTLYYPLPPTHRENVIYVSNETVKYIAEEIPVDNALYADFVKQSGTQADGKLYDKSYSNAGFFWYVFSKKGIAFLANPYQGYTIQVLRFEPTEYANFLNTTAKQFSITAESAPNTEKLH